MQTKNEPLKGKIYYAYKWERYECTFHFEDVKSAIRGLLEEIDYEIREWERRIKRKKVIPSFIHLSVNETEARIEELNYCKTLIKKWFPDLLEESGENGKITKVVQD